MFSQPSHSVPRNHTAARSQSIKHAHIKKPKIIRNNFQCRLNVFSLMYFGRPWTWYLYTAMRFLSSFPSLSQCSEIMFAHICVTFSASYVPIEGILNWFIIAVTREDIVRFMNFFSRYVSPGFQRTCRTLWVTLLLTEHVVNVVRQMPWMSTMKLENGVNPHLLRVGVRLGLHMCSEGAKKNHQSACSIGCCLHLEATLGYFSAWR